MSAIQSVGGVLQIVRDPDDVLDYVLDLSLWLGDDLLSAVTSTQSGVTVDSVSVNVDPLVVTESGVSRTIDPRKAIVMWLSGGAEAVTGEVDLHLVTAEARQRDLSIRVLSRSARMRR